MKAVSSPRVSSPSSTMVPADQEDQRLADDADDLGAGP